MNNIKNNLEYIHNEIEKICIKANRDPKEITLIGVSKTKPFELINEAIDLGLKDIGENYVQEIVDKKDNLKPVNIHFIGHLQSNKAKYIVPFAHIIHSVDSISLLKEINKQAIKNSKIQKVLLEVNISCEESKFGFDQNNLFDNLELTKEFSNIQIEGLMGMAPNTQDKSQTIPYFAKLKDLYDALPNNMRKYLSMGMSGDFREAILSGSNMIRIGTAIFGERNYNN